MDGPWSEDLGFTWRCSTLIELPHNLEVSHAALFSSGDLLVSGFDRTSKSPGLQLLNKSGQLVRTIDQPTGSDERLGGFDGMRSAAATVLVSHGDNILAWRLNTTDPIVDIQSNGSVREVKAALPAGFRIFNLVPSEGKDP